MKKTAAAQVVEITSPRVYLAETSGGFLHPQKQRCFCKQCGLEIEEDPLLCFWCMEPLCFACHGSNLGSCHQCIKIIADTKRLGAALSSRRKVKRGGRPKKIRLCKCGCGARLDATTRRQHQREKRR